MYTSILSASLQGLEAVPVCVEVDVSNGLPGFSMVGNLNSQVREAQDRVRTALHNGKFPLPPRRITVNISPGDIPKSGTGFDLPIAAAMLESMGYLPRHGLDGVMVTGEIGLDGRIRGVRGVLAVAGKAKERGCRACIVPGENLQEARMVEGIALAGVNSLEEFAEAVKRKAWKEEVIHIEDNVEEAFEEGDFGDICGQEAGKRAALLAAAGFHNLLLIGPPGSGKTMIARRIPGLLPGLARQEALELTGIYSVAGLLSREQPWITRRPFRSPHHTISPQAMAGGGRIPRPGEITLAHRGVLFLDELPELGRSSLELLRQPLEERKIWIARTEGRYCFPAGFLLVAAMNPCPCGYYPDRNRCCCTQVEVNRYLNRVSQPLLDRFDLCAQTSIPTYEEFREGREQEEETGGRWSSRKMKEQVLAVKKIQEERYREEAFRFNSEIPPEKINVYCPLQPEAEKLLKEAFAALGLSGRACNRIIRVARTAADLEGSEWIREEHMAEAVGFRSLNKQYWR